MKLDHLSRLASPVPLPPFVLDDYEQERRMESESSSLNGSLQFAIKFSLSSSSHQMKASSMFPTV